MIEKYFLEWKERESVGIPVVLFLGVRKQILISSLY